MKQRQASNDTFALASERNWVSANKCEFCLYKQLILQQLQRLKQAVILKNNRIKELEKFIKKISQMAFFDSISIMDEHQTSLSGEALNHNKPRIQEEEEEEESSFNQNYNDHQNLQKMMNGNRVVGVDDNSAQNNFLYAKKQLGDSNSIYFQNSKQTTATFSIKKQHQHQHLKNQHSNNHPSQQNKFHDHQQLEMTKMLQDLKQKQMKSIKQQIDRKFGKKPQQQAQSESKPKSAQIDIKKEQLQSQSNSRSQLQAPPDSLMNSLSQPQQQDPIGQIQQHQENQQQLLQSRQNRRGKSTGNKVMVTSLKKKKQNSKLGKDNLDKDSHSHTRSAQVYHQRHQQQSTDQPTFQGILINEEQEDENNYQSKQQQNLQQKPNKSSLDFIRQYMKKLT